MFVLLEKEEITAVYKGAIFTIMPFTNDEKERLQRACRIERELGQPGDVNWRMYLSKIIEKGLVGWKNVQTVRTREDIPFNPDNLKKLINHADESDFNAITNLILDPAATAMKTADALGKDSGSGMASV